MERPYLKAIDKLLQALIADDVNQVETAIDDLRALLPERSISSQEKRLLSCVSASKRAEHEWYRPCEYCHDDGIEANTYLVFRIEGLAVYQCPTCKMLHVETLERGGLNVH